MGRSEVEPPPVGSAPPPCIRQDATDVCRLGPHGPCRALQGLARPSPSLCSLFCSNRIPESRRPRRSAEAFKPAPGSRLRYAQCTACRLYSMPQTAHLTAFTVLIRTSYQPPHQSCSLTHSRQSRSFCQRHCWLRGTTCSFSSMSPRLPLRNHACRVDTVPSIGPAESLPSSRRGVQLDQPGCALITAVELLTSDREL